MRSRKKLAMLLSVAALGLTALGCEAGEVEDPAGEELPAEDPLGTEPVAPTPT